MTMLQQLLTSCHPCLKIFNIMFPSIFMKTHFLHCCRGTLPTVPIPVCRFWSFQILNSRINAIHDGRSSPALT